GIRGRSCAAGGPQSVVAGIFVGKGDGDTLGGDTIGFRDDLGMGWNGSVVTSTAKVRDRIRRPDLGHLEIEVTWRIPKRIRGLGRSRCGSSSGPMRSSSTKSVWKTKKTLSI